MLNYGYIGGTLVVLAGRDKYVAYLVQEYFMCDGK